MASRTAPQPITKTIRRSLKRMIAIPLGRHGNPLQWLMACGLGLVIGVYILQAVNLEEEWVILSMAALIVPLFVPIIGNVRRLLLAVILLEVPFQVDIYLFYRDAIAAKSSIGGLNLSITTMCLVVLYVMWLAELLSKTKMITEPLMRWLKPLLYYMGAVVVSMLVATDAVLSFFEFFLMLQTFLFILYLIYEVQTKEDVQFVMTMLMVSLVLESLVMIGLRFVLGASMDIATISLRLDESGRVGGTVGSPNTAGGYLGLSIAPALAYLLANWKGWTKTLALAAFVLGGVALLLTFSRGGWVAFLLSISIVFFFSWRRGWLPPAVPAAIVIASLVFAIFFGGEIVERLTADDGGAAYSRVPLMNLALRIVASNPIVGIGSNNFATVMKEFFTSEISRAWLSTVHNKYLLVWAETGTVGLVAFLTFLITTIRKGWQSWQAADREVSPLALGLMAGIIGHMFHMFFDIFNSRPMVQTLWINSALIIAIWKLTVWKPAEQERVQSSKEVARISYP